MYSHEQTQMQATSRAGYSSTMEHEHETSATGSGVNRYSCTSSPHKPVATHVCTVFSAEPGYRFPAVLAEYRTDLRQKPAARLIDQAWTLARSCVAVHTGVILLCSIPAPGHLTKSWLGLCHARTGEFPQTETTCRNCELHMTGSGKFCCLA